MVAVLYEGKLHGLLDDQQIILKILKQLRLSTMVYWIIYWKDALRSASRYHMNYVTTVTAFYNINLDYLTEGLLSLSFNTSY